MNICIKTPNQSFCVGLRNMNICIETASQSFCVGIRNMNICIKTASQCFCVGICNMSICIETTSQSLCVGIYKIEHLHQDTKPIFLHVHHDMHFCIIARQYLCMCITIWISAWRQQANISARCSGSRSWWCTTMASLVAIGSTVQDTSKHLLTFSTVAVTKTLNAAIKAVQKISSWWIFIKIFDTDHNHGCNAEI